MVQSPLMFKELIPGLNDVYSAKKMLDEHTKFTSFHFLLSIAVKLKLIATFCSKLTVGNSRMAFDGISVAFQVKRQEIQEVKNLLIHPRKYPFSIPFYNIAGSLMNTQYCRKFDVYTIFGNLNFTPKIRIVGN